MRTSRVIAGAAVGAALLFTSPQLAMAQPPTQPPKACELTWDGAGCSKGHKDGGGDIHVFVLGHTDLGPSSFVEDVKTADSHAISSGDLANLDSFYVHDEHYSDAYCSGDAKRGTVAHYLVSR
ncbi:MAG: hypothetical protein JWN46_803 [Acidimicrobiales bacterium]|nr:hypothetical protein [Acidimicrobiales bacterium]